MLQTVIDEAGEIEYQRAVALGKLGWIRALQSRYTEAKRLLERALEFHRTAGDVRERATLAMCLNWCEYGVGRFQSAVEFASRARAEAQTVGEPYNESVAMMRIGKARIAQGLYAEAGQILTTALENHKDLNAEHCRAETVWMLGRLKNAVGEYAEAEILLADALETVQKVGDREDEFRILIDRAELQINLKNFEAALALAVEAEKIAVEIEVADGAGAALVEQSFAFLHLENSKRPTKPPNEPLKFLNTAHRARSGALSTRLPWLLSKANPRI